MSALSLTGSVLIVTVCVALYSAETVTAGKKYTPPSKNTCSFVVDYSTVEASLRTSILKADTYAAAKVLESHEMFSLAAGFTYDDKLTCFVTQTADRRRDPDIVAFQAVALNAKKGGDTEKLARSIVLSFDNECECSFYTAKEKEKLVSNFKDILENEEDIRSILAFGHEEEDEPDRYSGKVTYGTPSGRRLMGSTTSVATYSRRRLTATEVSPTDSFICAYCDPPRECRKAGIHWCQRS